MGNKKRRFRVKKRTSATSKRPMTLYHGREQSLMRKTCQDSPELLAPAGTKDAFWAAIENGADAVYLGVSNLNARAAGRNFSIEETGRLIELAHLNDKKAFVALNCLVKESELGQVVKILAALNEFGADALIIQDLGVWSIARRFFPTLPLHASTLMTIHNEYGVRQAERMGFARAVLAREMTLEETLAVKKATQLDLEVFVHGALCFTYSGLCMFSSFSGGRSSTRGRCVQPCRRRFTWKTGTGSFFSMDDLCALDFLHDLKRIGIKSLKIEGRLRPAHYVAQVIKAYRMVLDANGNKIIDAIKEARELVREALGRPLCTGYLMSPRPRDAISPTRTANTGKFLGKIRKFSGKRLLVVGPAPPSPGDRLRLVFPKTDTQQGLNCIDVRVMKDGLFSVGIDKFPGSGGTGALLFKTDTTRSRFAGKKGVDGAPVQALVKRLGADTLKRIDKAAQAGASSAERLAQRLNRPPVPEQGNSRGGKRKRMRRATIFIKVKEIELLERLRHIEYQGLILEMTGDNCNRFMKGKPGWLRHRELIWALPPIIEQSNIARFQARLRALIANGHRNFQLSNIGHIALLRSCLDNPPKAEATVRTFGSYTLNLLNSQAVRAARRIGINYPQFTVETDFKNAKAAIKGHGLPVSITVYGFIPLFTSRMDHSTFSERMPVTSIRGEKYHWQRSWGTGLLLSEHPLSLLGYRKLLEDADFAAWIIDFSNWPRGWKFPRRPIKDIKALSRLARGRSFNFTGNLE